MTAVHFTFVTIPVQTEVDSGTMIRSQIFKWKGCGERTEIGRFRKVDRTVAKPVEALILRERKLLKGSGSRRHSRQSRPVKNTTGLRRGCSRKLGQTSDWRRSRRAELERALALDPLHLPADFPLIDLYKQQGQDAKAAELSSKVSAALEQGDGKPDSTNSSPTAEAAYKNIQVLKSIPSDQLIPTMRFITASLGVECSYCHVPDHFEKDDKKPKEIARNMMRMMFAIDKDNFAGNREITCYSCHRGSTKPEETPVVASDVLNAPVAEKLAANLPTADELIHNYIQAVGGAAAIERITSRQEKGTATVAGKSFGVEIFTQDPDKQALIRHTPSGDSAAIFDGQQGWFSFPNRPTREMHEADLEAARIDADLHFPINIKKNCPELRVEYPEKIGTRAANVRER
jgi:hypothetical protein